MVFDTHIYDPDIFFQVKSAWNSDAEFYQKFSSMGRLFARAVEEADDVFRRDLDISLLEPSVSASLSLPEGWAKLAKVK
jgi:hypothetical protein